MLATYLSAPCCVQEHSQQTASDLERLKESVEKVKEQIQAAESAIQDITTAATKLEKERSEVCVCVRVHVHVHVHMCACIGCLHSMVPPKLVCALFPGVARSHFDARKESR